MKKAGSATLPDMAECLLNPSSSAGAARGEVTRGTVGNCSKWGSLKLPTESQFSCQKEKNKSKPEMV
ncbi:hypothetical protein SRHO_G00230290 [Serrasalmus rhombeus]